MSVRVLSLHHYLNILLHIRTLIKYKRVVQALQQSQKVHFKMAHKLHMQALMNVQKMQVTSNQL